jgi:putative transposase
LSLIENLKVHSAGLQDRDGAKLVFNPALQLKVLWADSAYTGKLVTWAKRNRKCRLQVVKRHKDTKGFKVLPKRWLVERTFAWLGNYRLLDKEHELSPESSEADVFLVMTKIMLRRFAS